MTQEPALTRRADAKSSARGRSTRPAPSGVPSLISADMSISGEVRAEGEVQFDGEIDGNIHAKGLVIGEGACVRGEVVAEKVKVAGNVEGRVRATRVELTSTSVVNGDIVHTALMIEAGARFEGSARHSDDPLNDAGPAARRELPAPSKDMAAQPVAPAPREMEAREPAPVRRQAEAPAEKKAEPMQQMRQGKAIGGSKVNLR